MANLVTLDAAKTHLRITGNAEDHDIFQKLVQAQALVFDYLSDTTDADWTAEVAAWTANTLPASVEAAILLQLTSLHRYRGDEPDGSEHGALAFGVKACLYRVRKPVIA